MSGILHVSHIISYGQSLASGWEGGPPLSLAPAKGTLMLGHSVRPQKEVSMLWVPVGDDALRPLVATAQLGGNGPVLTTEQLASLPDDAFLLGETVLEAASGVWSVGMPDSASNRWVLASSCGVGGRTLEHLSPGAQPELFNRLRNCAAAARSAVERDGGSYSIAALLFLQGESNSWALDGGTDDRLSYKVLLRRFFENFVAEVVQRIAGQTTAPHMFLHQTGGAYASETLGVAQAQLEFALEREGCTLVAPIYPLPDRPMGHLDANGYRWLGQQFGKVMHRVLTLGEKWQPLHPQRAILTGNRLSVAFHVPVPPLAWGRPMAGLERLEIRDCGFAVLDAGGEVPIADIALDGPTGVCITLARVPQGDVTLRYADRNHRGRGMLHDSDATMATDVFAHDPTRPDTGSGDVAAMVGRPYSLENWCVAFSIAVKRFD